MTETGLLPADDDLLAEDYEVEADRWLRVNFVTSLDGVVSVDGRSGALGSDGDRRVFRVLRALADVVLVGAGTAAAEGYRPVLPDSEVGQLRAELDRPPVIPVAVVSRRVSLAPDDQLVRNAVVPTLLVTCASSDAAKRAALAEAGVEVLVCGDDDVDLRAAVDALADRGLAQVLCEGGPALFADALAAGVVDELDLTIAPVLAGGDARLVGPALPSLARGTLDQVLTNQGYLFTRYLLH